LRSTITHIASGLRVFTHTNPSFAQTDHRKKKLVEYLLANGVDVKAASIDGWTALHLQVQALFRFLDRYCGDDAGALCAR
jgi:hypothetical protein